MEEVTNVTNVSNATNVTNDSSEIISFKYHGKTYTSTYQMKGSSIIYSNKEMLDIQEELANKPDLAVLIDAEDNLEYFDNYEELQKSLRKPEFFSNVSTRGTIGAKLTTHLHIDVGYSGGGQTYERYTPVELPPGALNQVWVADMSTIALSKKGLNQKLSSIQLLSIVYDRSSFGGFLTIWDKKNFTGYSATWFLDYNTTSIKVKDLSKYLRGPAPLALNWNDAAQSLKFGY